MHPDRRELPSSTGHRVFARWAGALLLFGLWVIGLLIAFPPSPDLLVEIDLASDTAGHLQIFVDGGRGFREDLSARASVPGDGSLHRHRLVLPAPAVLHGLRLDPLDRAGELVVQRIDLTFGGRHYRFEGDSLNAWRPVHEVQSEGPDHALRLFAEGPDPQLHLAGPGNPFESPWHRLRALPDGRRVVLMVLALPLLLLALTAGRRPLGAAGETLLALVAPLGLLFVHGLRTLGDWWLLDDPCLLASTLRHGPWAHFFDPQVWRPLSGNVLMPWTTLSFAFDAHLFGPEPQVFYAHQLVSFILLIVLAYALLRPLLTALGASLALSLFVASAPAMAVAWRLMNRHYLEGAVLAIAAIALYRHAVERGRFSSALAGAACYLLATTAKEVFVPLVVLLPCLPVADLRRRLRYAAPFVAVGGLYALWRLYMLGMVNSFSGYAAGEPSSALRQALAAPRLLGITEAWQGLAVGILLVVALGTVARRSRTHLLFVTSATLVLVLPLLPVIDRLAPRHFFLPALAFSCVLAACARPWLSRHPLPVTAGALVLLLLGLGTLEQSPVWRHRDQEVSQYRAAGEFVLRAPPGQMLFTDLLNTSFLACLGELRQTLGLGAGPGFCGDPCWCADRFSGGEATRVEHGLVVPFDPTPDSACAVPRALSVEMRYDAASSRLSWHLGPDPSGAYEVMLVHGEDPLEVSPPVPIGPRGSTPWTFDRPLRWIVKYRASEGWVTFSPVLELDRESPSLFWRRLEAPQKRTDPAPKEAESGQPFR